MGATFFGKNLIYLRELRKVKQAKIAEIVGKKQNTISNWEAGRNDPDFESLGKIITFFDISIYDFLYVDLEKGNLIEKNKSDKNTEKGNLKGNLAGNLITENQVAEPMFGYKKAEGPDDLNALVDTLEKLVISKDEVINLLKMRVKDLEAHIEHGSKKQEKAQPGKQVAVTSK